MFLKLVDINIEQRRAALNSDNTRSPVGLAHLRDDTLSSAGESILVTDEFDVSKETRRLRGRRVPSPNFANSLLQFHTAGAKCIRFRRKENFLKLRRASGYVVVCQIHPFASGIMCIVSVQKKSVAFAPNSHCVLCSLHWLCSMCVCVCPAVTLPVGGRSSEVRSTSQTPAKSRKV